MSECLQCGKYLDDRWGLCSQCAFPVEVIHDCEMISDREGRHNLSRLPLFDEIANAMLKYWDMPMCRAQLIGNSLRLSQTQAPKIYGIAQKYASRLSIPMPEIFIKYDPSYNAQTIGIKSKHMVILNSSLIDDFDDAELSSVIAHEMGHIRFNHVLYNTILYLLSSGTKIFLGIAVAPIYAAAMAWSRQSEFTADRVSLLTTMNLKASMGALLKLTVGSKKILEEINIKELIDQSDFKNFYSTLNIMFETHPYMVDRMRNLIDFVDIVRVRHYLRQRGIPVFCNVCGYALVEESLFCSHCGTQVNPK